ncbi:Elongator subunit elp2 [Homalodisca vitripennis]|nr:Elongator subunit elp2 [Homalodisca vitripennis]
MLPNFRFVSGADEKVVRAFTAPQNFLENFKRLCLKNTKDVESDDKLVSLPTGAAVPVLGLSNKAVFQYEPVSQPEERHVKDQYDESSYFTPQQFEGRQLSLKFAPIIALTTAFCAMKTFLKSGDDPHITIPYLRID